MHLNTYIVVKDIYEAWKRGDLETFGALCAPNVTFSVPSSTTTYVGTGSGRHELTRRLQAFLDGYDVLQFDIVAASPSQDACVCRINYAYRSRETGLEIQGSQRHIWQVAGNEIVSFTVVHDAPRLGAFFGLTSNTPPSDLLLPQS